ncbi:hypothetical protein SCLCIDRAFT_30693 [Scleroderma citrinum Foug A]|uniref:Uncharacterized protein n=1 Tax=Scleroderma citrinum Foug A TaxID=1036808 RepID=A0A0C2YZJ1_9AGAM|nr:hypothetical protein SCLCIDRAFT_30693 [Scleroderma citrinum Foug A]
MHNGHVDALVGRPPSNVWSGIQVAVQFGFDLGPIASMPGSNDPIRMFGVGLGWLHCASAFQAAITTVSIAIAIASPLALNTRHNRLSSALGLSECKRSACGLNWRVHWYIHLNLSNADLSPLPDRLGSRDFACLSHLHFRFDARDLSASIRCVRPVSNAIRLVYRSFDAICMPTHCSKAYTCVSAGSVPWPALPSASSTHSLSLVPSLQSLNFTPAVSSATFDSLGPSAIEFFVLLLAHTSHSPTSGDLCVPVKFYLLEL